MCTRVYSGILYYYFVRGGGGFKCTSTQWDGDGSRFVTVYECLSVCLSVHTHAKYIGIMGTGQWAGIGVYTWCVCFGLRKSMKSLADNITILISPIRQRYDILS